MQATDYPHGKDSPVKLNGQTVFTNYYIVYPEGKFAFTIQKMRDDLVEQKLSFQEMKDLGYTPQIEVGGDMIVTS